MLTNLLDTPSAPAPSGQLYAAIFYAGIGPVFGDEDVYQAIERSGDVTALPPISKQGNIWGIVVKVRPGAPQTIDGVFGGWKAGLIPGFAEATLTLEAVALVHSPSELGDVTLAAASSDTINPGFLGIGTAVGKATGAVGAVVSTAVRDLIIMLLIVLAIVIAVKFLPKAAKA